MLTIFILFSINISKCFVSQVTIIIYLSVVGALLLYMLFLLLVDPLIRKQDPYTQPLHNEEDSEVTVFFILFFFSSAEYEVLKFIPCVCVLFSGDAATTGQQPGPRKHSPGAG